MQPPSTTSADSTGRSARPMPAEPMPDRARPTHNFAFMRSRLSHWIALGFGSGLSPVAPGTVGTLWAWAAFLALDPWLSDTGWWSLIAVSFAVGCWACRNTGRNLGVLDHSGMVWDEIVAFWAVLLIVPAGVISQMLAFFVFRAFDVIKPPPIRYFDRTLKGGFGVMFDDALAAFMTVLVFAIWMAIFR